MAVSAGRGGRYLCRCPVKAPRSPVGTLFGTGGIPVSDGKRPVWALYGVTGAYGGPGPFMCLFSGCIRGTGWSLMRRCPFKAPRSPAETFWGTGGYFLSRMKNGLYGPYTASPGHMGVRDRLCVCSPAVSAGRDGASCADARLRPPEAPQRRFGGQEVYFLSRMENSLYGPLNAF